MAYKNTYKNTIGLFCVEHHDVGLKMMYMNGKLYCIERPDEYKELYAKGQLHREGDLPAVEYVYGYRAWYVNGQYHRGCGLPAVEYSNGDKSWWVNGHRHRDNDLPAVEKANGSKEWYKFGQRHREGGLPAIYSIDGYRGWRLYGKILSQEKGLAYFAFCQKMKEKTVFELRRKYISGGSRFATTWNTTAVVVRGWHRKTWRYLRV